MKLNILTTAAVLALTGAALTQAAKAQFVPPTANNPNSNANGEDLILSFALGGGTTNYELDLGQASIYETATSSINIANINTDLSSIFGSGYGMNTNLRFGILGVDPDAGTDAQGNTFNSVFVSFNAAQGPFPAESNSSLNTAAVKVDTIYSPNSTGANLPTKGSTLGSFLVPTSNVDSFNNVQSGDGFGTQDTIAFNTAGTPAMLNLEVLVHGPGTKSTTLGSTKILSGVFDVTSSGAVQYTLVSAPEPSTYGLMLLGAGILVWRMRRKSVHSL